MPSVTDLIKLRDDAAAARREADAAALRARRLSVELRAAERTHLRATARLADARLALAAVQQAVDQIPAARGALQTARQALAELEAQLKETDARLAQLEEEIARAQRAGQPPSRQQLMEQRTLQRTRAALEQRRPAATADVAKAEQQLAALETQAQQRPAALAAVESAEAGVKENAERRNRLELAAQAAGQEAALLLTSAETLAARLQLALDRLIAGLRTDVPIALLPVRIETRFRLSTAAGVPGELLIRIYPDDIHSDSHETGLTDEERRWGQHFWRETWKAGTVPRGDSAYPKRRAQELAAWQQLAARFGPARAAYVAARLSPINERSRPAAFDPDGPAVEPEFDAKLASRGSSWTRAPRARALPDRWLAIGSGSGRANNTVWGALIPASLAIGADPSAPAPPPGVGQTNVPVDPGMQWMVDFAEAERVGMGIRMVLSADEAAGGFDRVIVVGVKGTLSETDGATELGELIDAHRFTWGCEFVPQGTPTNNTEQADAGYSRTDVGYQRSFALEREEPARARAGTDGGEAALALGIDVARVSRLRHADGHDQREAACFNRVLWPVTVGYFLNQIANDILPGPDPDGWREYFVQHVRARGPLPPLRIGRQPYGLLPVTSLDLWRGPRMDLASVVRGLRDAWRASLVNVARAGRSGDGGLDLVETLGLAAVSNSYSWRWARGPRFFDLFWRLPTQPVAPATLDAAKQTLADRLRTVLQALGLSDGQWTRLASTTFAGVAFDWEGPLIEAGPLSETEALQHNYVRLLVDPDISLSEVHDETAKLIAAGVPKPLLYMLLRHATLLAYAEQALPGWPGARTSAIAPPWFEPELVDLEREPSDDVPGDPFKTPTFWRVLQTIRGGATLSLGDELRAAGKSAPQPLQGFLASLLQLADVPTAALARLLGETLDLSSHRLDAWITSFATSRLRALRAAAPAGIYLGGYSWVENLRPRAAAPLSDGFVHAPSLAQATTAAVLRSGYLAYRDQPVGARLAIDLSSRRVRLAKGLIDGVRDGQPLSALLGYRFERTLTDSGIRLNRFIAPLRQLAPLAGQLLPADATEPVDAIAADQVVDGLKLLALHKEGAIPFPAWNATTAERGAVEAALQDIDDAVDAIGDLALAESVHQAAQGNYTRAGATLDAISRGERPADALELLATPHTGVGFTQRLAAVLSEKLPPATSWSRSRARAVAEPVLNSWVEQLLGSPARVLCQAAFFNPRKNSVSVVPDAVVPLPLDAIDVCALDLVYAPPIARQPQQTELELRLARAALQRRPAAIDGDASVRLVFDRHPDVHQDDALTLPDLFELARAVRELVTNARPLDARDFTRAGSGGEPRTEVPAKPLDEVMTVWSTAKERLRGFFEVAGQSSLDLLAAEPFNVPSSSLGQSVNLLDVIRIPDLPRPIEVAAVCGALGAPPLSRLDGLRDALDTFAAFSVQGAVPVSMAGGTAAARDELVRQASQVHEQVVNMERQLAAIRGTTVDDTLAKLAVLFGEGFRVLPAFTLAAKAPLQTAMQRRVRAGDAGPAAVLPWLQTVARVRDGAQRLTSVMTYAAVLGTDPDAAFQVAQFPFDDNDRWNTPDGPAAAGATSIVVYARGDIDPAARHAGLMIDEWTEVIPRRTMPTTLAFHYDAPGARAPQAVLLAVSPDPASPWTAATLEAIVAETLELAKLRAVDHDALTSLGHVLPAIFLANNAGGDPAGDTVSSGLSS